VNSLRVRLLASAAATFVLALLGSWFAMTLIFQKHIEHRLESELMQMARQLVAALTLDADGRPTIDRAPAEPLFEELRGGLYWALSSQKGQLKSRSLGDQRLPSSPIAKSVMWDTRIAEGPFAQKLLLLERLVQPHRGGGTVLVQLALNYDMVRHARQEFGWDLASYFLLLWLILCGAAWAQVELSLLPLTRVRRELDSLKSNPTERLSSDHPLEVQPLTRAINELADARERDLSAARRRAADLAHALKTPLAALSAGSRRVRDTGAADLADGLDRAVASAGTAVNAELARWRVARLRGASAEKRADAQHVAESVIGVVERTNFGAELVFQVDIPPSVLVPMAAEDLAELLGALIENAARFARRRVSVSGEQGQAGSRIVIEDDGPGLGPTSVEQLLSGVGRADEVGGGTGLGLRIARDLVEATDGHITISAAALGGLRVQLDWLTQKAPAIPPQRPPPT